MKVFLWDYFMELFANLPAAKWKRSAARLVNSGKSTAHCSWLDRLTWSRIIFRRGEIARPRIKL
jgi:hypothetical protein